MPRRPRFRSRARPAWQLRFAFEERAERRERAFRRGIVATTLAAVAGIVLAMPTGRYLVRRGISRTQATARNLLGMEPNRAEVMAEWKLRRERGVTQTTATYREIVAEADPAMRRLIDFAGLAPGEAVLRWGNYNKILLLPGSVFEADDSGRSYRMRPNVRSVWLKGVALPRGLDGFFLVPDRPELSQILPGTGAFVVPGSAQTTNSWGCRGPEPDPSAPLRGLVLGDSNMQGLFVADDQSPPETLRADLQERLRVRCSMLNTGHLGYSPEQYYACLVEYGERFRPQFVVVSPCLNDFGDVADVLEGRADWDEARFWLDQIAQYCRTRNILCILTPIPVDHQVTGARGSDVYPGPIERLMGVSSLNYVFPIEDLVDEFLRLRLESVRSGAGFSGDPLYNSRIDDHHFSPLGTAVWGRALGRRLALLLEDRRARGQVSF